MARILQEEANPSVGKEPLATISYPSFKVGAKSSLKREITETKGFWDTIVSVQSCPTEVTVPTSLIFYSILYELEGHRESSWSTRKYRDALSDHGHKPLRAKSPTLSPCHPCHMPHSSLRSSYYHHLSKHLTCLSVFLAAVNSSWVISTLLSPEYSLSLCYSRQLRTRIVNRFLLS